MALEDDLKSGAPLREHVSPEGVEERIVFDVRYLVTQTQGGKFRFYSFNPVSLKYTPHLIHDTIDESRKNLGSALTIMGMMINDPVGSMKQILAAITTKAPPKKDGA